jgi:hypothetical protein
MAHYEPLLKSSAWREQAFHGERKSVYRSCLLLLLRSLEYAPYATLHVQERERSKNEHPEVNVEHGFVGTFGTSNKYRMMDRDRSAWTLTVAKEFHRAVVSYLVTVIE